MVEERDLSVSVPGGSIYVKAWTPEQASSLEPIVLLHDSLGCVGLWRDFPSVLAGHIGRRVIAYDRLGFGRSSPRHELPSLRFIAEEVEYVELVMDAVGVERAVLFGYSVGGSMALSAAAASDRFTAVISESAQAFVEDRTLEGIAIAKERFGGEDQIEPLRRSHGDKVAWILRAWFEVWTSPAYAHWSLAPVLPLVKVPVLVIHGDRDDYGSEAFPSMIYGLVGGEKEMLLLENCGHMPRREYPEVVLDSVGRFLNRHVEGPADPVRDHIN